MMVLMTKLSRYSLALALSLCAALAAPAFGQSSKAKDRPERMIDVKKVFGYYDLYLNLPPQDRDGFAMRYSINARSGAVRPQMFYMLGTTRTTITVAPSGQIMTMPDLNMYRNGKVVIPAGQPSGSINLDLDARVPLSRTISAADAANPINDYAAATRRAGPLAMIAPRLTSVRFIGGTGGEAILRDGRRVPLRPAPEGGVLFTPSSADLRGATSLSFASAPTSVEFAR
jgi:hypothetical protein